MTKPKNRPTRRTKRREVALDNLALTQQRGKKFDTSALTDEDRARIRAEAKALKHRIDTAPVADPTTKKLLLTASERRKAHRRGVLAR